MREDPRFCPLCRTPLGAKIEDGRKRRCCPECGWIHYLNPLPCAAALVLRSGGEVLLVRRGVEPGKGLWGLPSGFIEIDETPEEACLRELREETCLEGMIGDLVGVYSQESSVYKFVIIIGYRVDAAGDPSPGSDSEETAFFPLNRLPTIAFPSHRAIIRDGTRENRPPGKKVTI